MPTSAVHQYAPWISSSTQAPMDSTPAIAHFRRRVPCATGVGDGNFKQQRSAQSQGLRVTAVPPAYVSGAPLPGCCCSPGGQGLTRSIAQPYGRGREYACHKVKQRAAVCAMLSHSSAARIQPPDDHVQLTSGLRTLCCDVMLHRCPLPMLCDHGSPHAVRHSVLAQKAHRTQLGYS